MKGLGGDTVNGGVPLFWFRFNFDLRIWCVFPISINPEDIMISHASDQPGTIPTLRSKNTFVLALLSWNCSKMAPLVTSPHRWQTSGCPTSGKEFRKTTPELHCWLPWHVSNMASLITSFTTQVKVFFKGHYMYNVKTNADSNPIKRLKIETKHLQF